MLLSINTYAFAQDFGNLDTLGKAYERVSASGEWKWEIQDIIGKESGRWCN